MRSEGDHSDELTERTIEVGGYTDRQKETNREDLLVPSPSKIDLNKTVNFDVP